MKRSRSVEGSLSGSRSRNSKRTPTSPSTHKTGSIDFATTDLIHNNSPALSIEPCRRKTHDLRVLYQSCSTILQKRQSPREIRQVASKGKSPYHFCQTFKIMLLQKWQTNEIFKGIQSAGLNPQEFEFEDSGAEARLKHKWSRSCFVFAGNASQYTGHRVVGDGINSPYEVYRWEAVMSRFGHWVKEVKDDLDTPDLWAELQRDARLLGSLSGKASENKPFTSEEQKDIEQRLRKVEAHVRETYSLTESDFNLLRKKIDYLVDAAGRLGRIDWLNACAGAIIGFILSVGLPSQSVLPFMTDLLHHVFEHGLPQLPFGG